jgi:hypothetical protein
MTALQAKKITITDEEFDIFCAFINHNYPKFMNNYKIWESHMRLRFDIEQLSLAEVNEQFRLLYAETDRSSPFYYFD